MKPFPDFPRLAEWAKRHAYGPVGALMLGKVRDAPMPATFRAHWHPAEPNTVVVGSRVTDWPPHAQEVA